MSEFLSDELYAANLTIERQAEEIKHLREALRKIRDHPRMPESVRFLIGRALLGAGLEGEKR